MAKELIISSNRHETKVALFEDEQLVEMYFQRADEYSLAGSIHKGRVTRVLPGMQSAFVNIGLERDAFLYVSDFFEESEEEFDKSPVPVKERSRQPRVVDEDTGEPADESNERFATAQTVASLVKEQEAAEEGEEGEEEIVAAAPVVSAAPVARPAAAPVHREDFADDRRGRRRRRRRGRGGAGLPESKFADGTRGENRPPRREEDEDSRWNRKPTTPPAPHFEDEDPPQSVMIAKVSDPNRLPPPPRRTPDFVSPVLPGESLAKYRRGKGGEGRGDFDRKRGERQPDLRLDPEETAGGGRYSTPRKSRHGSRQPGFLAPADDDTPPSGGSEEMEFDVLSEEFDVLSEGSFASLLPPGSPKAYMTVDGEDDSPAEEATEDAAEESKAAGKKTARKKATKAVKAASSTAKKKAKSGDEAEGKSTKKSASRGKAKSESTEEAADAASASEDAETVAAEGEAPLFVEAGSEAVPEAAAPETAAVDDSGFDGPEAAAEDDAVSDTEPGEIALAEEDEAEAGAAGEARPAEPGTQRLSRRERRRLRMLEKREERRRERSDRRPAEESAVAAEVPVEAAAAEPELETVAEAPVAREARPEREGRREREGRPSRESREREGREREGRDREDRMARDRDGRDREGRDREGRDRDSRDRDSRDRFRGKNTQAAPLISEVLKEGQEVLVQIAKEPLGQKGARITSHIALPGRYVVYMPTVEHVGVSRKVGTDQERARLRKILQSGREGMPGGFICRTAAEGRSEEEIHADMQFLNTLWQEIKNKADKSNPPALIHHDLDIVQRVLRDQLTEEFKTIWVDNEELYERILRFVQNFQPSLVSRVRLYTKPAPIFDTFNVTSELEKALRPKVWLKSGGYIVINQTEALVAIDVNTGKFVGKSNRLEDTIVKTNLEAVKEAVRQIRLRDLGGIIVVDFIDMDERRNRQKVMQALDEAMKEDRAPYKILQFNDFGLVAITRKRVKQSLERTLCQPCPYCEGAGYIKNVPTVIGEILTEAQKIAKAVEGEVSLRVNPEVGKVLKSHTNNYLEELEEILKVPVIVTSDPLLHQEKFDLA